MRFFIALFLPVFLFFTAPNISYGVEMPTMLHVYTWDDYFSPEAIRLFEQKHNCRVEFDYYDSNETMFESLSRGGGYDIVTPSGELASHLARRGVLRPLDHSLIPNLKFLNEDYTAASEDPNMTFSVLYTVTATGIGYNRRLVPEDALGSWDIFGDERLAGKMTLLNDFRETIGAGLKLLGHSINTTSFEEIQAAGKILSDWKKNIVLFDVDSAKYGLGDGKYLAIQAYNGDIAHLMQDHPDIDFYIPKEGTALNSDTLGVCSDSEEPELAHAFINHFLDPEIAIMNMEYITYLMPNKGDPKGLERFLERNPALFIPPEVREKCEMIKSIRRGRELFDRVWVDVLIGK